MKPPCSLLLASLVVLSLVVRANAGETAGPVEPGFEPLFNGRDLSGWTVKCKPADRERTWWRVEEGTIVADSMEAGKHDYLWLVSEREYGDFVLRLRFQAFRDNPGNSGVQIRSRYDDEAGWLDGPQVDLNPPGPWRSGMVWDETRGNQRWLWPEIPKGTWVDESMILGKAPFYFAHEQPAWNDLEISARGTEIAAVLNGVPVMKWNGRGVLDDAIHRERRVGMLGHLALQIHTGDRLKIRFKDIRVREL
ncbi:MAG: 3-keto-disaccharide hydrolase [Limisphaerales bacterium]